MHVNKLDRTVEQICFRYTGLLQFRFVTEQFIDETEQIRLLISLFHDILSFNERCCQAENEKLSLPDKPDTCQNVIRSENRV